LEPRQFHVWKIQEGYEIKELERAFGKISFKAPLDQLSFNYPDMANKSLPKITSDFIEKHFLYHQEEVFQFFNLYHNKIALHSKGLLEEIKTKIKREKPKAILYALGSSTLLEALYAQAAIENNIPIFYFKHCGIENTFLAPSFLDNYFEKSPNIKRVQYTHSTIEEDELLNIENIRPITIHPIEKYYIPSQTQKKAILYSLGPSSTWSLKDLHKITLDSERIGFIYEIINWCKLSLTPLHIKVHPADWENSYRYFSQIIKDQNIPIKLIAGGSIERIIDQYEVVALDLISTKVLNSCLLAGKKTLLFKPKGIKTSEKYFPYLRKRVEVVENIKDLSKTLNVLFEKDYDINTKVEEFNQKFYGPRNREETLELIWKNLNSSN
jgi:hypothetical protein